MIDNNDIKKLIEAFSEVFPTKEEAVSKKEFESFMEEYHNNMNDLQKSVDAYAVKADKYFQEQQCWPIR